VKTIGFGKDGVKCKNYEILSDFNVEKNKFQRHYHDKYLSTTKA
jgi:hypothetical protein